MNVSKLFLLSFLFLPFVSVGMERENQPDNKKSRRFRVSPSNRYRRRAISNAQRENEQKQKRALCQEYQSTFRKNTKAKILKECEKTLTSIKPDHLNIIKQIYAQNRINDQQLNINSPFLGNIGELFYSITQEIIGSNRTYSIDALLCAILTVRDNLVKEMAQAQNMYPDYTH